jgi:hypothetical protein
MRILQWKTICEYCKRCLKLGTIYGPIFEYYNGCKKSTTIYKTYMQVLHIRNDIMEVRNKKRKVLCV